MCVCLCETRISNAARVETRLAVATQLRQWLVASFPLGSSPPAVGWFTDSAF